MNECNECNECNEWSGSNQLAGNYVLAMPDKNTLANLVASGWVCLVDCRSEFISGKLSLIN